MTLAGADVVAGWVQGLWRWAGLWEEGEETERPDSALKKCARRRETEWWLEGARGEGGLRLFNFEWARC